jgi:hypothetical protein
MKLYVSMNQKPKPRLYQENWYKKNEGCDVLNPMESLHKRRSNLED